jgi:hypothetical protein
MPRCNLEGRIATNADSSARPLPERYVNLVCAIVLLYVLKRFSKLLTIREDAAPSKYTE